MTKLQRKDEMMPKRESLENSSLCGNQQPNPDEGTDQRPVARRSCKRSEAQSALKGVMIWSGLHGNMQRDERSGRGVAAPAEQFDYLGGFGLVHGAAANARIVKWDSAA